MGTFVFPEADLKIFLDAKPTVRAERRYRELFRNSQMLRRLLSSRYLEEIQTRDLKIYNARFIPFKTS